MKLLTKRLLAVALTIAMTLCMAMSAMALDGVSDDLLESVGLDPDEAEWLSPWIEFKPGTGSSSATLVFVEPNSDGKYVVDLSEYAKSGYTNFAIVHNHQGNGQEIFSGTSVTMDDLSPFRLVGQKKDGSAVDDDDDSSSSSSSKSKSSSSGKKSPKTGMDDSWMLWLMAAGVFAGASVVAYNKKKG